jgi:hypothetical protein
VWCGEDGLDWGIGDGDDRLVPDEDLSAAAMPVLFVFLFSNFDKP